MDFLHTQRPADCTLVN